MDSQWLIENWALVAGAAVVLLVAAVALVHSIRSSAGGRLRGARRVLRQKRRLLRRATAACSAAQHEVERLQDRAERVTPRRLEEARGRLDDSRALAKIAHDQVLIAENHVRRIIVQEFPPQRQPRLRAKYGVGEQPDKRPFTF